MTQQTVSETRQREFIRHPTGVPIRIHCEETARRTVRNLSNISVGGLACRSDEAMPIGCEVMVEIPVSTPPFQARGTVCWCRALPAKGFELGIRFTSREDAFAARMVEQLCQIERYRKHVKDHQGREIDSAEAAIEWINIYAERFPSFAA